MIAPKRRSSEDSLPIPSSLRRYDGRTAWVTLPNGPTQVAGGSPPPRPPAPLPAASAARGGLLRNDAQRMAVRLRARRMNSSTATSRARMRTRVELVCDPFDRLTVRSRYDSAGGVRQTRFSHRPPAFRTAKAPVAPCRNRWSVQNNTNQWTIATGPDAGENAADQFVIQSMAVLTVSASGRSTSRSKRTPGRVGRTRTLRLSNGPAAFRL